MTAPAVGPHPAASTGSATRTYAFELAPIGIAETPYAALAECPRDPWSCSEAAVIRLHSPCAPVIDGIVAGTRLYVLWWAHRAVRAALRRRPTADAPASGVCVSRGPDRPNPIGLTLVEVLAVHRAALKVRGLDCVDGSPVLDLKPALVADGALWQ